MRARVLVCDDEELIRWSVCEHLKKGGFDVTSADDGVHCLEVVEAFAPDAVLLDLKMPRMGGIEVLASLGASHPELPIIVMTAHGGIDTAIEATQLGAVAYLPKPFDLREVTLKIEKAIKDTQLAREVQLLRQGRVGYERLIGQSRAMANVFDTLGQLEGVDTPTVLITGESGTGKDLVARAIHARGPRKDAPFVEVDCTALPEHLIESELFGHERGAFTDAKQQKRGLFEVAAGGVLFLDEIGEMPVALQAKLLRALENRTFKRVGGVVDLPLSASVVTATNRALEAEVKAGRFREDLFFRLNVIRIEIPPLRARKGDIQLLALHLLDKLKLETGHNIDSVSEQALASLEDYRWPGNVRELRNVVERIAILHRAEETVRLEHLPLEVRRANNSAAAGDLFELPEDGLVLDDVVTSLIHQALERTGGNQSAAARLLGVTRYTLRYRMEKHGLSS